MPPAEQDKESSAESVEPARKEGEGPGTPEAQTEDGNLAGGRSDISGEKSDRERDLELQREGQTQSLEDAELVRVVRKSSTAQKGETCIPFTACAMTDEETGRCYSHDSESRALLDSAEEQVSTGCTGKVCKD